MKNHFLEAQKSKYSELIREFDKRRFRDSFEGDVAPDKVIAFINGAVAEINGLQNQVDVLKEELNKIKNPPEEEVAPAAV